MKKIGKYSVLERIGVGGFGEVYKAHDPFIKRYVAVKTCTSDDQETRNRFFKEAEIAGKLNHRNITTVYDFGVDGEVPYLIQEYLSGEDLDRKIKRQEFLPYPEKVLYLIQIARGLAYAHQQGVIHRDVKPANIRVLEDGTVKIMDFGIAKLAQQETGLTKTGMTVGTAAYLAPEQIRGEGVDHRTDVFSFGVLAYELLTFERPFQGEQISAVIYQILNREPKPLREVWPAAPADMVELITRCLAKDPADRFADGADLLRHLEAIQQQGRATAAPELATREIPQAAAAAPAEPRRPSLDDLELSSVSLEEVRSRAVPLRGAAAARPGRGRWVLLAVLGLLALGAGWWLGDPQRREMLFGATTPDATTPDAATPDAGAPAAGITEGPVTAEPPAPEAAPPETPPPVEPEVPPPPPPPPPEPEPGRLVVSRVPWTDALTVRVGKTPYPLTRERSFPLAPGTYQVVFELAEPGYEVSATVAVEIREGEQERLEAPILQPGALSVRARPGRAQARITCGGQDLGTSPIRGRKMAPGQYPIRIAPLAGEDGALERQVLIAAGQETVLTFDLEAGTVHDAVNPLE